MNDSEQRSRLMSLTRLASEYCMTLENCREMEREEFISAMLGYLPRLYTEFLELDAESLGGEAEYEYFRTYVDEDYYETIRRNVEILMGPDDVYLETFEEDMKYSDTPVAASVSESLADIFQPLYDFISLMRDTAGENAAGAYADCREKFESYWSQTLCNVLRPLNALRIKN